MNKRGGWIKSFHKEKEQEFRKAHNESGGDEYRAARAGGFKYSIATYKAVWKKIGLTNPKKKASLERRVYYEFSELP